MSNHMYISIYIYMSICKIEILLGTSSLLTATINTSTYCKKKLEIPHVFMFCETYDLVKCDLFRKLKIFVLLIFNMFCVPSFLSFCLSSFPSFLSFHSSFSFFSFFLPFLAFSLSLPCSKPRHTNYMYKSIIVYNL